MDAKSTIAGLANRFKEPSSWAGVGALLVLAHINVDPGMVSSITLVGAGVAGIVSFFLPEKKS